MSFEYFWWGVGGSAALVAYRVEGNPILAINIGASAPAILLSLAEGIKTRTAE